MQKRSTDIKRVPQVRIRIIIVPLFLLAATVIHHLMYKYAEVREENFSRENYEIIRKDLRPYVQQSLDIAAVNSNNQQVIDELKKRTAHTFPVSRLLETIRNDLPDTVQFNSFDYLSIPIMSTTENPYTFRQDWPFSFSINGTIQSSLPEQDMLVYLHSLENDYFIDTWFKTMQMTRFTPIDQTNIVQFRIEGEGELISQIRLYKYDFLNNGTLE